MHRRRTAYGACKKLAIHMIAALAVLAMGASARAAGGPTAVAVTPADPGSVAAGEAGSATPAPPTAAGPATAQGVPATQSTSAASAPPPAPAGQPPPSQPRAATHPAVARTIASAGAIGRAHGRRAQAGSKSAPRARAAAGASVTIRDFSFGPSAITIHTGDTVTWINEGPSNHTATAGAIFNTGVLRTGQSASQVFSRAGTFSYRCSIHPFMRGTVTVLPTSNPASPSPTEAGAGNGGGSGGSSHASAPAQGSGAGLAAASPTGPALPNTGLDARREMAIGLAMLLLGMVLLLAARRRRGPSARGSRD